MATDIYDSHASAVEARCPECKAMTAIVSGNTSAQHNVVAGFYHAETCRFAATANKLRKLHRIA